MSCHCGGHSNGGVPRPTAKRLPSVVPSLGGASSSDGPAPMVVDSVADGKDEKRSSPPELDVRSQELFVPGCVALKWDSSRKVVMMEVPGSGQEPIPIDSSRQGVSEGQQLRPISTILPAPMEAQKFRVARSSRSTLTTQLSQVGPNMLVPLSLPVSSSMV